MPFFKCFIILFILSFRWPKLDFEAHKEFKKLNKNKVRIEKKKNKPGYDEDDEGLE